MKTFAHIQDGAVFDLLTIENDRNIYEFFPRSMQWVEVTGFLPKPEQHWTYDGRVFAAPVRPALPSLVPAAVTMRQARIALLATGKLNAVGEAIEALPSPQKEAAQIEWEYALMVDRASPLTSLIGSSLGLDDAAIDELFLTAAQI